MGIKFNLRPGKIVVVQLFGKIGGSIKSPVYEKLIERLRKDKSCKALVLDIDSPGGTVTDSEYIYHVLSRFGSDKPIVSNVRGLGASGAYLIACAGRTIVASPGAIVGSIGVISIRPMVEELLKKAGIDVNVTKTGLYKDMGAYWRPTTKEEEIKLQSFVDESYKRFLGVVINARGLPKTEVENLANGEVFWGAAALENGLVDKLGTLDTAIDLASDLAKCKRRVVTLGPKKSLMQKITGSLSSSLVDSTVNELETRIWSDYVRY